MNKIHNFKSFFLNSILFVISTFIYPTCLLAGVPHDRLQKEIGKIKVESHAKNHIVVIEKKLLNLVNEFNSPEEKGRIYVELGRLGGNGLDHKKIVSYCKEALTYPLEPLEACEMYFGSGDNNGGLAFVQKYLKINSQQEVPLVINCDTPDNNSPCWEEHRVSLKAAEEANFQNELLFWRNLFLKALKRGH